MQRCFDSHILLIISLVAISLVGCGGDDGAALDQRHGREALEKSG